MPRKVALVTGASSDIGFDITKSLASSGYQVIAQVHSNSAMFKDLDPKLPIKVIQHELSLAEQVESFLRLVKSEQAGLDVVVNTVGPLMAKPLLELTPAEWRQQMHLNLDLAFYLSHFAKDALVKSRGHLVHFAFSGAEILKARVDTTPYCVAKAGIVVLTKSLASALAPYGVRVNAIAPGLIELGEPQGEERKKMAAEIPLGRPGRPSEISDVLLWLLGSSPAYVTGAVIPVAGAWEYI